jgi:hypothetical protein
MLIGKRRRKACDFQFTHEHTKKTRVYIYIYNLNKGALKYRGGRKTSISTLLF